VVQMPERGRGIDEAVAAGARTRGGGV
jgi:hypothetical protein